MLISANHGLLGKRQGKPRYTVFESVRFLGAAGFEAVDVNFYATTYHGNAHEMILDGDWRAGIGKLKETIETLGLVSESTHAPCDHADEPPEVCGEFLRRSIEATEMLGAKYMVVHPLMGEGRTMVEETIRHYLPYEALAKEHGVTLAVENMISTSAEELAAMSAGIGCGVCWDTGHANLAGRDQYGSVTTLGNTLKVLHIHDNYGGRDNHNPPGFGTVDWDGFTKALKDIGYSGAFNFEVSAAHMRDGARMEMARYLVKMGMLFTGRAEDVLTLDGAVRRQAERENED